jgi:hypothetical protein
LFFAGPLLSQKPLVFVTRFRSKLRMLPFISSYDPQGGLGRTIDPLGVMQAYGGLADLLLPGITTITNRARYLTMMCAALRNAETYIPMPPGAAGLAKRREAIEPFERLWALACVAAKFSNRKAVDGLRGITRAEKAYQQFESKNRPANPDFELLKYQARTGAVGVYWSCLVGSQLIHPDNGALQEEGRELAECFPVPPLSPSDLKRLADPIHARGVRLSLNALESWGEDCHLAAAQQAEKRLLEDALTCDDTRNTVQQSLLEYQKQEELPDRWEIRNLKRLQGILARQKKGVELGLPSVIEGIIRLERFHEAALAFFDSLLFWGTVKSEQPLKNLLQSQHVRSVQKACPVTASEMLEFYTDCPHPRVRDHLQSVLGFASAISNVHSPETLLRETLERHRQVQSGKLSGGSPKREWLTTDGARILRPSIFYQRTSAPLEPTGEVLTHPYRLEPFVRMLRETGSLRRQRSKVS